MVTPHYSVVSTCVREPTTAVAAARCLARHTLIFMAEANNNVFYSSTFIKLRYVCLKNEDKRA